MPARLGLEPESDAGRRKAPIGGACLSAAERGRARGLGWDRRKGWAGCWAFLFCFSFANKIKQFNLNLNLKEFKFKLNNKLENNARQHEMHKPYFSLYLFL